MLLQKKKYKIMSSLSIENLRKMNRSTKELIGFRSSGYDWRAAKSIVSSSLLFPCNLFVECISAAASSLSICCCLIFSTLWNTISSLECSACTALADASWMGSPLKSARETVIFFLLFKSVSCSCSASSSSTA